MKTTRQETTQTYGKASPEQLFEKLHDACWPTLFRLACRKLGDPDEAYDLLQELFIELWDKREVFPLHSLSLPWLKKRLWYKLITHFRNQGFKQRHLENFRHFLEQKQVLMQSQESLNRELESQHAVIMEAIALAVAQMPERMQEVFLLNREQQFSIQEIAHRLGLSPNTVRNHLQAAMKRLRQSLEAQNLSALGVALLWWMISA